MNDNTPRVSLYSFFREYRYFWVSYNNKGLFRVGRYGEKNAISEYQDESPLKIKYYGVTSYECKSWWKFYTLCPGMSLIQCLTLSPIELKSIVFFDTSPFWSGERFFTFIRNRESLPMKTVMEWMKCTPLPIQAFKSIVGEVERSQWQRSEAKTDVFRMPNDW